MAPPCDCSRLRSGLRRRAGWPAPHLANRPRRESRLRLAGRSLGFGETAQCRGIGVRETEAQATWHTNDQLLVLADAGGSNGCRVRAWKERLQVHICDGLGLTVTVCHYPTGCSKWNLIEHRLFSQISRNWAGVPLRTWDTLLAFIRGTTTQTGLSVHAIFQPGHYPKGQRSPMPTWRL